MFAWLTWRQGAIGSSVVSHDTARSQLQFHGSSKSPSLCSTFLLMCLPEMFVQVHFEDLQKSTDGHQP